MKLKTTIGCSLFYGVAIACALLTAGAIASSIASEDEKSNQHSLGIGIASILIGYGSKSLGDSLIEDDRTEGNSEKARSNLNARAKIKEWGMDKPEIKEAIAKSKGTGRGEL